MLIRRPSRGTRLLLAAVFLTALEIPIHPSVAFAESVETVTTATLPAARVTTIRLPIQVNLVAASVPSTTRVPSLDVAVGQHWIPVTFESDHGPERQELRHADPRRFSEALWIGTERAIRIRNTGGAANVRLHLINTRGDASVAPAPLRFLGSLWRGLFTPRAAHAEPAQPFIIPRSSWGADESWRSGGPGIAARLDAIFIHHTATGNDHAKADVPAIVRGIYRYHTKTRGWSDIGYGLLVDRWGRVFEGRAGGVTEAVVGAHAREHNTRTVGISMIGTYDTQMPSYAARQALVRLVAWKADVHHMPLVGAATLGDGGHRHARLSGHRDANGTACPGTKLYGFLKWVRRSANQLGHPKLYNPYASRVLRPDGDGSLDVWRIGGYLSETANWTVTIRDAAASTVFSASGTGRAFVDATGEPLTWDGRGASGALVPTGRYTWTLEGANASGEPFRGADGEIVVVAGHPDGTLLVDGTGTYWSRGGQAQPVSDLVRRTTFAHRTPVATGPDERLRLVPGPPVSIRDGVLLEDPSGERFVIADGTRRRFATPEIFDSLGYDAAAAIAITETERDSIPLGTPIDDTTTHPKGTIVRSETTADGVTTTSYWSITATTRRPLSYGMGIRSRIPTAEIVDATPGDLALPEGPRLGPMDGHLVTRSGRTWIVAAGVRREFVDPDIEQLMGFWSPMFSWVSSSELSEAPAAGTIP